MSGEGADVRGGGPFGSLVAPGSEALCGEVVSAGLCRAMCGHVHRQGPASPHKPGGGPVRQHPSPPSRARPPRGSSRPRPGTAPRRTPPPWTCSPSSCRPAGASPRLSLSSSPPAGDRPPLGGRGLGGGTRVGGMPGMASLSVGEKHSDCTWNPTPQPVPVRAPSAPVARVAC